MLVRGNRALLNLPGFESTAAIVVEIQDTRSWKDGLDADGEKVSEWSIPEYTFQFANCDRSIAFDLEWRTGAERENSLHKIDTMIESLKAFRKGVADEQRRYAKRMAEYRKNNS